MLKFYLCSSEFKGRK